MGKRRLTSQSPAGSPKRNRRPTRDDEDEADVPEFERRVRQQQEWLETAKRVTALPIKTLDGIFSPPIEADKDTTETQLQDAVERTRQRQETRKRERQEKRLNQKKVVKANNLFKSKYMNPQERMNLRKTYPEFVANIESMKLVIADVSEKVMLDPTANLYWLELLMHGLAVFQAQWETRSLQGEEEARLLLLVLFSAGKMLTHCLPTYVMADHESKNDTDVQLSKDVKALRRHESHLLDIYRRFLFRHLFELSRVRQLQPLLIRFISQFAGVAFHTNFQTDFANVFVRLLLETETGPDLESLLGTLETAFRQDLALSISADLTKEIIRRLSELRQRRVSPPGASRVLRAFAALEISKKENSAKLEMKRAGLSEGLDLSKSRDATERKMDQAMTKDVAAGLVHGDWRKFRQNKSVILTQLLTFFSKVLRSPNLFPVAVVLQTLQSVAEFAQHVNVELMIEILEAIRALCSQFKQHTAISGPILIASVSAAIRLIQLSPANMSLVTDSAWTGEVVLRAVRQIYVDITDPETRLDERTQSSTESSQLEHGVVTTLDVHKFLEILEFLLESRAIFGTALASASGLAKCPKAIELFVSLLTAMSLSQGLDLEKMERFLAKMIQKFPCIKGTIEEDGVIISSLSDTYTVSWLLHQMEASRDPTVVSLSRSLHRNCG
eukprot:Gregarina_sp_Poly_1__1360@NODE_1338_length_4352_cov_80_604901_g899_i0_p1_GENE_NODE_1338_length_4352_cov_80_604901_g899_i0NODE_1338_length_4352_cov_80_604901_g899_i0_p1_ORF_typecomplete_len678_score125_15NOC3p/PF07540_11/1_8e04NOC3p/PF07540_11/2_9e08CTNNBL/PF08216_11/2_7e03CTNNBL/PF08216_11/3_3CTNNBL/PF08216_11/1_3e03_NODE_1338_length_4352_cov_80_604901_g899_i023184330